MYTVNPLAIAVAIDWKNEITLVPYTLVVLTLIVPKVKKAAVSLIQFPPPGLPGAPNPLNTNLSQ